MLENLRPEPFRHKILVVDGEELVTDLAAAFLSRLGYPIKKATSGVDALDKMRGNKFDAAITDIKTPDIDGIILTREISKQYPGLPVMVMTAHDEEYSAVTAISFGAQEFMKKPFILPEFGITYGEQGNYEEVPQRIVPNLGREMSFDFYLSQFHLF